MDIILLRHGQSVANERGLLIADATDDLNDHGIAQSQALASRIQPEVAAANWLYCSPWKRAMTTAEIVLGARMGETTLDPRLAETFPGQHGTWLATDFNAAFPDFYHDLGRPYEGGESHRDMMRRVCQWVDTEVLPRQADPGLLVAVTHGGPITVVLQYLLGMPLEPRYPSFTVSNASVTHLSWRQDLERFCLLTAGASAPA